MRTGEVGMSENANDVQPTTPTDAPRARPTLVPPFSLEELARDAGFRSLPSLLSNTVLEVVEDVSWSAAKLDLVEIEVLGHVDGVSPVMLLESVVSVSRDELHAMLATLLARGVLRLVSQDPVDLPGPASGIFRGDSALDEDVTQEDRLLRAI
jgi:hypothetical protein